jgi:LCP family protein required for cell wall assembly
VRHAARARPAGDPPVNDAVDDNVSDPPDPPEPGGRGRRGHAAHGGRRRHRLRITLIVLAVVVALVAGGGTYVYRKLNGNLTEAALSNGTGGASNGGTEKADPVGRTPINVLVIGSDSRATKADCKLGGDCDPGGTGANADVEMLVHVSADRSNMTVMSIPRDLVTNLPACTDPATGAKVAARVGQINSTLSWGPGCTVAAVHELTGIVVDHFTEVDFSGVVKISDAVGGVSVCVNNNVYDTYSHLKLSKGTHILKGTAALEFVRSRHAFGDGSDLGRTYAQHVFLSSAVRSLKSTGVLLNPAALYKVASAATKALTVDKGLGSIPKLLGLASDLNKVPTGRVTFTTMQTEPDPSDSNRVVAAPAAAKLFETIVRDQSLSVAPKATPSASATAGPTATPSPTPSPTVSVDLSAFSVRVQNSSGATGRAATVSGALTQKGFRATTVADGTTTANSVVRYGTGRLDDARAVAAALKLPASRLVKMTGAGVIVVVGTDWTSGTAFSTQGSAASRQAALSQAHAQTATKSSCVPVSTQRTVEYDGVPLTPIQAYAAATTVKNSAP